MKKEIKLIIECDTNNDYNQNISFKNTKELAKYLETFIGDVDYLDDEILYLKECNNEYRNYLTYFQEIYGDSDEQTKNIFINISNVFITYETFIKEHLKYNVKPIIPGIYNNIYDINNIEESFWLSIDKDIEFILEKSEYNSDYTDITNHDCRIKIIYI